MGKSVIKTYLSDKTGDVVLTDTGEILQKDDNVIERKIIVEDTVNVTDTDDSIVFNKGDNFVKLYDAIVPKLTKELTPTEITFVLQLAPLVSYDDCVIRTSRHGNSDPVNAKQLAEIMDMDYTKVTRMLNSLTQKGVIGYHITGSILSDYYGKKKRVYTVNPYIYFRGVKVNKAVYEYYDKSGWKDL